MLTRYADWQILPIPPAAAELQQVTGGHPLVAQVMAQRGISDPAAARAFLDPAAYRPASPYDLPDMARAVELLDESVKQQCHILIWGDFDVDGQTATSLLLDALRALGADATFYLPNRLRESHGIRVERLADLIRQRKPDVLLTCDTGVSEHQAVRFANQQNITTIITDHHDLPSSLPEAAAVINPKRLDRDHPLASLPGVGTAYKLIEALYTQLGREDELPRFLDLVALGIVADVMEQRADTRYLLQRGLEAIHQSERLGLQALIKVAGLSQEHIDAEAIGFQLAPRLNAVGRLDDADQAVALLTTQDPVQAQVTAANLDGLNNKRRVMQRQITTAAKEIIAAQPDLLDFNALVIDHPEWHPGLLGIVAGQLAEQYQKPCVLLQSPSAEPLARGSARSARGYDIGQAIAAQAEMLHSYGGHTGAAGVSLQKEEIARFRRRLSRTLDEQQPSQEPSLLTINAAVPLHEVNLDLVREIERLAPFGEGNPPVILMTADLTITSNQIIGRDRLHRRLRVRSEDGTEREVLWWRSADEHLSGDRFDLAYTVGQRIYKGETSLEITLSAVRAQHLVEAAELPPPRLVEDWRQRSTEQDITAAFRTQEPEGVIWAEGAHSSEIERIQRWAREKADALLIYTAPPSARILQHVIEQTKAHRIYLLGIVPPEQNLHTFVNRLFGLVKHAISNKGGQLELEKLAAAAAQTETAVLAGLRFLAATGAIILNKKIGDRMTAELAHEPRPTGDDERQEAELVLRTALAESAAYRAFFCRAEPDALLD